MAVELTKKEHAIEELTAQGSKDAAQMADLQASLEQATTRKAAEEGDINKQKQEITGLMAELSAAKAASEEQASALQTTKVQIALLNTEKEQLTAELQSALQEKTKLTELNSSLQASASEQSDNLTAQLIDLEEKAATATDLEAKNQELAAALEDKQSALAETQEKVTVLETSLASLQAERVQLLLHSVDSDNDGVSDAKDKCADTVQGAEVDAEGCEGDSDQDGLADRLDLCPGTATGAEIDKKGCSADQTTIVLEGINFQLGTANLTEDARLVLNKAAKILQDNPDSKMEVAGHTDSLGETEANLRLSTARAQAVLNYLVSQGVAENNL